MLHIKASAIFSALIEAIIYRPQSAYNLWDCVTHVVIPSISYQWFSTQKNIFKLNKRFFWNDSMRWCYNNISAEKWDSFYHVTWIWFWKMPKSRQKLKRFSQRKLLLHLDGDQPYLLKQERRLTYWISLFQWVWNFFFHTFHFLWMSSFTFSCKMQPMW